MLKNSDALAMIQNAERGNERALGAILRELLGGQAHSQLSEIAGTGITSGTGTLVKSGVHRYGSLIKTEIFIDLTGLTSADSDLDVIGVEDTTAPCHIGRINFGICGTPLHGTLKCLEAPASLTDLGIYSAGSGVLVYEDLITDESDETVIVTPAVQAVANQAVVFAGLPSNDDYLYLVNGAGDTPDAFTAGKLLFEMWGYDA